MIIGKVFISGLGVESLLFCHGLYEVVVNKVAKIINKHVESTNSGPSEVPPNLGNEARLS